MTSKRRVQCPLLRFTSVLLSRVEQGQFLVCTPRIQLRKHKTVPTPNFFSAARKRANYVSISGDPPICLQPSEKCCVGTGNPSMALVVDNASRLFFVPLMFFPTTTSRNIKLREPPRAAAHRGSRAISKCNLSARNVMGRITSLSPVSVHIPPTCYPLQQAVNMRRRKHFQVNNCVTCCSGLSPQEDVKLKL